MLENIGCAKMVDGYKQFDIEGFEKFFDIKSLEEQEEYINSGKLDIYKSEGILFLPFIKEISDTECAILVFPYFKNTNNKIRLDEVSLTTPEGDVISIIKEYGEIKALSKWNDSMVIVNTFNKSEEWFYNGNNLTLNINASISSGNECVAIGISYNVTIRGYKGTTLQVQCTFFLLNGVQNEVNRTPKIHLPLQHTGLVCYRLGKNAPGW